MRHLLLLRVRAAHCVAGNTINVNPETGVVEMDCKGLTLGRFYYVPTRRCSTCFRITRDPFDQVRISSSNVLGFGPARVLSHSAAFSPPKPRTQLMSSVCTLRLTASSDIFVQFNRHQRVLHVGSRQVRACLPCSSSRQLTFACSGNWWLSRHQSQEL